MPTATITCICYLQDNEELSAAHRQCWTCRQFVPESGYFKGDIAKYFNCKSCEATRHRQLVARHRNVPEPDTVPACPKCKQSTILKKSAKGFDHYICVCGCLLRYKVRKPTASNLARYYGGRQFCEECSTYNIIGRHGFDECVNVRIKRKKLVKISCDLDESMPSSDDELCMNTLSQRIDSIVNSLCK